MTNVTNARGATLDTGMLIGLERRRFGARERLDHLLRRRLPVVVPAVVIAEWWRGRSDVREKILASVTVEPLSEATARLAGEAMAAVRGATVVDAVVMASAAARGDVVYTSDADDLVRLRAFFPNVRVIGIG